MKKIHSFMTSSVWGATLSRCATVGLTQELTIESTAAMAWSYSSGDPPPPSTWKEKSSGARLSLWLLGSMNSW